VLSWGLKVRLEGLLLTLVFLWEAASQTPAWLTLTLAGFACLALLVWLASGIAGGSGTLTKLADQFGWGFGIFVVGCLLLVCSQTLGSGGLGVLGLAAVLIALFGSRASNLASTGQARLQAGLAVLLISLAALRLMILLPAEWYAAPLTRLASVTARLFGIGQVSCLAEAIVLDGTEIHASHLVNSWLLVPVLYGFLCGVQPVRVRLAKLILSFLIGFLLNSLCVLALTRLAQPDLLFSPSLDILSVLAGYGLALVFWPPRQPEKAEERDETLPSAALVPLLVAGSLAFLPAGRKPQELTFAIDESHGRWETTLAEFDRTSYGRDTVYNYRLLRDWLTAQFPVQLVTGQLVDVKADVIIVKTPTTYFSQEEKDFLKSFVRAGGTLLVVGDHTNLFGTSAIINDLLGWAGLRLNFDAVLSSVSAHHNLEPKWWNPVASDPGISRIEIQTGASIASTNPLVDMLLVADSVYAERADYSNERFFGELSPSSDDRKGPVCLCARRHYGRGSVILFSDSTIWSNFSFYAVSNERLFSSLIREHGHKQHWLGSLLTFLCLWLLALLIWQRSRRAVGRPMRTGQVVLWTLSLLSVLCVIWRAAAVWLAGAPWPAGSGGLTRAAFDARSSGIELRADVRKGTGRDLSDYSTFYAWLSRAGLHPLYLQEHCYDDPAIPALIINPKHPLDIARLKQVSSFLKAGGRMLFLFDPDLQDPEIAGRFLAEFGIKVRPGRAEGSLHDAAGPDLHPHLLSLPFDLLAATAAAKGRERMSLGELRYSLSGLTPLLVDSAGLVVAGQKSIGKGRLTVFARSSLFSEHFFGDVWGGKEPSPAKLQAYRFAYELAAHALSK